MQFPTGRKARTFVAGFAALLVVGAIVGATALGGGSDAGDSVASRAGLDESLPAHSDAPEAVESGSAAMGAVGGGVAAGDDAVVDASAGRTAEQLGGEGVVPGGADVIKRATVEIDLGEEGDLAAARERALSTVRSAGGFVESSQVSDGSATMTFRVPAGDFDAVLGRIRDLGEVTSENVTGEDVSAEVVDLEARLRHWRAQEAAFLELMEETISISETIEIRRELGTIQQQIEQIQARMRFLDDRVEFSTLTVGLVTPVAGVTPVDDGQGTLSEAWDQAWEAALSVVGGTLIVLGVLIPLSAVVGIPGVILWSVLRRRRGGTAPAPAA